MTLSRLNLILFPSMLALAAPGGAEARQTSAPARPLNLSLPHDALRAPGTSGVDETVQRNLHAPEPPPLPSGAPGRLPYGAGYEHRHMEVDGVTAGGAGAGSGSPSAPGSGRPGR